jgi:hypothetical protein
MTIGTEVGIHPLKFMLYECSEICLTWYLLVSNITLSLILVVIY